MSRITFLIAALAGTLAIQACAFNPPSAPTTNQSGPSIEPSAQSATRTGTDIRVSLEGTRYATQYVSGDIEEILIGLYDVNPGNPVDPDANLNFAFSIGGWMKTDNAAPYQMAGMEYPLPYFDDIRYLVDQLADSPNYEFHNGRYMIRHLTKAGGGYTSPSVHEGVTFYNIPDGNYKIFAAAIKNGVIIGRDVEGLEFDASDRVFYQGNSGASYVRANLVPVLCLELDPNPDVPTNVGIHDDESTPSF